MCMCVCLWGRVCEKQAAMHEKHNLQVYTGMASISRVCKGRVEQTWHSEFEMIVNINPFGGLGFPGVLETTVDTRGVRRGGRTTFCN